MEAEIGNLTNFHTIIQGLGYYDNIAVLKIQDGCPQMKCVQ